MLCEFLTPEAYPYSLWAGRKIELYEGKHHVGTMVIEEIMNKNLDRNTEFENDKDVLLNPDIINIALKLSLEWGKGFVKPLDIKLMKALPYLSGTDIEKYLNMLFRCEMMFFGKYIIRIGM